MNVMLLLNGPAGCQTGIEDGFSHLVSIGRISGLRQLYYEDCAKSIGENNTLIKACTIAEIFLPQIIIIFHVGKFGITSKFLEKLKNLKSKPILVYDEGDMYGSWAKPILPSIRRLVQFVDVVSIRGLGSFYNKLFKLNNCIVYTPHHADIARYDKEPFLLSERANKLVLIGNKIKPRFLSSFRRLPGARGRERFVRHLGDVYGSDFALHGNGWSGFIGDRGPVDFYQQLDVYRQSWVTVAYEHYPEIPYYFSNRLPIALLAGSLYVCHYHKGYENIFKGCDFIFFFETNSEAVDIINYIHSLSKIELYARSERAREFSLKYFHPNVVWSNFIENVLDIAK